VGQTIHSDRNLGSVEALLRSFGKVKSKHALGTFNKASIPSFANTSTFQ
jgi:hypothetical protein